MEKTVYERVSELEFKIGRIKPVGFDIGRIERIEESLALLMKDYERRMKHLERVANSKRVKKHGV